MVEDIRISQQVADVQEKNEKALDEKMDKVATEIKQHLDEKFEGCYDESYGFMLYMRKGNDVNTMMVKSIFGQGVSTGADRGLIRDSLNNLSDQLRMDIEQEDL